MKDFQFQLFGPAPVISQSRGFTIPACDQDQSDEEDERELEEAEREREEQERDEEEAERRLRESESEKEEAGFEEQRATYNDRVGRPLPRGARCYSSRALREERAFEKFVAACYEDGYDAERESQGWGALHSGCTTGATRTRADRYPPRLLLERT